MQAKDTQKVAIINSRQRIQKLG